MADDVKATERLSVFLLIFSTMLVGHASQAFYNPSTGRWLSRDPISEADGAHLYAMTGNSPVLGIDVVGLKQKRLSWAAQPDGSGLLMVCGDTTQAHETDAAFKDANEVTLKGIANLTDLSENDIKTLNPRDSATYGLSKPLRDGTTLAITLTKSSKFPDLTDDMLLLVRGTYAEGPNTEDGKLRVVYVIMNRVDMYTSHRGRITEIEGRSIREVLYKKGQFAAVTPKPSDKFRNSENPRRLTLIKDVKEWNMSVAQARKVYPYSKATNADYKKMYYFGRNANNPVTDPNIKATVNGPFDDHYYVSIDW